ncbi:hypothetical protein HPB50_007168 [Hyalomma asiaticum]|uniref:Uncharacterized protein n=1 Tax=Hyalomma asiaticum TaxID=266040 RepID=A0ACB7SIN7_HYAAI|nr:hypothetical protein HPB50_007168 [Hyalomma asiaticum]
MKSKARTEKGDQAKPDRRVVVVPYAHHLSHRLKETAAKCGVPVLLSAPEKLSRMCPPVDNREHNRPGCTKKYADPIVTCSTGVVYRISLSFGN